MTVKEMAQNILDSLPGDVSWDELQYHLYLGKVIEESNEQIDAGLGLSQEEVEERFAKWLK